MNLVLFPLEGISQTMLWQYRETMPVLWDLVGRSMSFRRFYSSATSSFQAHIDLFYGDTNQLDHNLAACTQPGCIAGTRENIWETLSRSGWFIRGFAQGSPLPTHFTDGFHGGWPAESEFTGFAERPPFHEALRAFFRERAAQSAPFALYCGDRASRFLDTSGDKACLTLMHERFERGFALVDETLGVVMESLAASGRLADTLVVIPGLYGADPWKHSIAGGRMYGVEPYADSVWTPLMLFMNGAHAMTADQVVSLPDLNPTILKILFPDREVPPPENITHGVNVLEFSRHAAFSQNLYALERENHGPAAGLVKSYGVTDGDQRLLVTADGPESPGGMELYYDLRDPGNTRNILDFFALDGGDIREFESRQCAHTHFVNSFKPSAVVGMIHSYNAMKQQLQEFVVLKETQAQRRCGGKGKKNLLAKSAFSRKRQRR